MFIGKDRVSNEKGSVFIDLILNDEPRFYPNVLFFQADIITIVQLLILLKILKLILYWIQLLRW